MHIYSNNIHRLLKPKLPQPLESNTEFSFPKPYFVLQMFSRMPCAEKTTIMLEQTKN